MKKKTLHIALFFAAFLFFCSLKGISQTKTYVYKRIVVKSYTNKKNLKLEINALKANLFIKSWDKNELSIKLTLISKSPDIELAKKENTYHKYYFNEKRNAISITNKFILPPKVNGLEAFHSAVYVISVPKNMQIVVNNSYGQIEVENISGVVVLHNEFGKIDLNDISGIIKCYTNFSDVRANNIRGDYTIMSEHSDMELNLRSGIYYIKNKYANIDIQFLDYIKRLEISAVKCEINIAPNIFTAYDYDLFSDGGSITIDSIHKKDIKFSTFENKLDLRHNGSRHIKIYTTINNININ